MYHPYFRGKQYELITIRENAELLSESGFIPIIEPVREALTGLDRALAAVCEKRGQAIVIVNPHHGEHAGGGDGITALLQDQYADNAGISPGILLKEQTTIDDALRCFEVHERATPTLIHAGFTDGAQLAERLGRRASEMRHVFLEDQSGRLYRRNFRSEQRILVRDGFQKRRNRDHPPVEFFSDLHVTYEEEGMSGFGDYLTVGDDFSEGGGPAYAIAIHLTFIDSNNDDAMFVHHFLSERQDTPTDPAGKFAEALRAMIAELDRPDSPVLETLAVQEFRDFHRKGHYPGLGYVKKLSMQHHIETLANYLGR